MNRLEAANIRSFICHGNHDPLDGWEAQITLPGGCHRFGAKLSQAPVFEDEPGRAVVYGISYPQREVRESLVPLFGAVEAGPFNIGLLHANVDSNPAHDSYSPTLHRKFQARGARVLAWDLDFDRDMEKMADARLEAIVTDSLQEMLDQKQELAKRLS